MKTIQKENNIYKIKVDIFNREYKLKSHDASPDYMAEIASYVDSKMKELYQQFQGNISFQDLAVLTAINITDELFQEKNRATSEEIIARKTRYLIQLLEEGIYGDPVI